MIPCRLSVFLLKHQFFKRLIGLLSGRTMQNSCSLREKNTPISLFWLAEFLEFEVLLRSDWLLRRSVHVTHSPGCRFCLFLVPLDHFLLPSRHFLTELKHANHETSFVLINQHGPGWYQLQTGQQLIKTNDNYCRLPVDQDQLFSHTYIWFASCQLEFLSLWATMKTTGLPRIIVLPL